MILVAGGTGRLGSLLVTRLLDSGLSVRVLTRDASKARRVLPSAVDVSGGDVRDPVAVARAVDGCQVVVSAVQGLTGGHGSSPASVDRDGNRNLTDAARSHGASLVLVSVIGAAADSPMELFRMKAAAERYLQDSGIPSTVVQASAFLELWVDLLRSSARRGGRPVILGRGDVARNYVSVQDVAALLHQVVTDPSTRGQTLRIAGPQNLSLNDLATSLQHSASGPTGPARHVPTVLVRVAAATLGLLVPSVGRVLRAGVAQDRLDLTCPLEGIRDDLPGVPSTTLDEAIAALDRVPETT